MKFGVVRLEESLGGIVAHRLRFGQLVLDKGDIVLADHVAALRELGVKEIVVARMEADEVDENAAAIAVAEALSGDHIAIRSPATGRVNLHARCDGIFVATAPSIDRVNDVDEAITLATVAPMRAVLEGEMVATVKIIPFAVSNAALSAALVAARDCRLSAAPFRPQRIGVVSTLLPGLKPGVVDKTLKVLAERIAAFGSSIAIEERCAHEPAALARTVASVAKTSDIVVVFGASAITDRRDVIPAAIEQCGGAIIHFGMPVDPGNLLLLGRLDNGIPVVGAPGCARSCKENGFDWVLQLMLARLPVTSRDIRRMGAGGLIVEPAQRIQTVAQRRPFSLAHFEAARPQGAERAAEIRARLADSSAGN